MKRLLVLITLLMMVSMTAVNAATITILNNDGVNEGFNDPAVVAPVGGNTATTLGQQRLNVFQKAADIWAGLLSSPVTIIVRAQFNPQTCTATSAILGSAGPSSLHRNFANAPQLNTWYHVAMASKFAGVDVDLVNNFDINATFNSNLNGQVSCLNGTGWYLGYDGIEGSNIELLPVVLHELGHGLGFSAQIPASGVEPGTPAGPTRYERFIRDNTQGLTWDQMTVAQRAASGINTGNVVWNGPCANGHAPYVLLGNPTMWVNQGIGLLPSYPTGLAGWGPQNYNVTANCVLGDDGIAPNSDACSALINGGAVSGNICVVDRGTCTFASKALTAQAAGAVACIIVNNVAGPAPGLGGTGPGVNIPTVSLSQADHGAQERHARRYGERHARIRSGSARRHGRGQRSHQTVRAESVRGRLVDLALGCQCIPAPADGARDQQQPVQHRGPHVLDVRGSRLAH